MGDKLHWLKKIYDKLVAGITVTQSGSIEVTQATASDLNVKSSYNTEQDTDFISDSGVRETPIALGYSYDPAIIGWKRILRNYSDKGLLVHSYQDNIARTISGNVTVIQPDSNQLKTLVFQNNTNRIVSGTVATLFTPYNTILGSAITLTDADQDYKLPASEQLGRKILVIFNISDTTVYIGGAGVETTDGMPIASGKYMVMPFASDVYGVCGSAGKILRLSECKY